jgi:chromosome partitioning protein
MQIKAECIAFANPKGGCGKTTSCLSIAGYLVKNGGKVLVVDFDPQASATSGLGIDSKTLRNSIYDTVLAYCDGYEGLSISHVLLETDIKNLHLAPSEPDLAVAEVLIGNTRKRTNILKRVLEEVINLYDYILIDLPPGLGLLTINGLCASDQVIVPLEPSVFSLEALDNLKISFREIKRLNGHPFGQITAILNRYVKPDLFSRLTRKRNSSQEVESRLKEMFGTVFIIPDSSLVYKTQQKGIPISHYAGESKLGKAYEIVAKSISTNSNHKIDKEQI